MSENESNTFHTFTKSEVRAKDFDYRAAVKATREANQSNQRIHGLVMWNAALVYGEVKRRGLIGPKAGAAGWPTQVAYASDAGYKESSGSLIGTLAVAIDKGVKVGTPEWSDLVQGRAGFAKAVKGAKNLAAFKAEAKRLRTEPKPTGKKSGAKKTADEKKTKVPTTVKSTPQDIAVALSAIRVALHDLSDKGWKEVEPMLAKVAKDENHRRQLLSQRKAREAAKNPTPADMPTKVLAPTG